MWIFLKMFNIHQLECPIFYKILLIFIINKVYHKFYLT